MNIQNVDCKSILPSLYCIDLETNQPTNQPANRPSMSFLSVLVHWIQRMLHWNKSEKKSSHSIQPQILFPTLVLSSFLSFLFVCLYISLFAKPMNLIYCIDSRFWTASCTCWRVSKYLSWQLAIQDCSRESRRSPCHDNDNDSDGDNLWTR